jgi:hypothetical protein
MDFTSSSDSFDRNIIQSTLAHPDDQVLFEFPTNLLLTTIANEVWVAITIKVRQFDILLTRVERVERVERGEVLHTIAFAHLSTVMMNPDNSELRLESKLYSGWFTLKFDSYFDYEHILDYIQRRSAEVFKQIVFEFKTIQQDKRYHLVDYDTLSSRARPIVVHKQFKQQQLLFRIYSR